jgi:hypothetical protein
MVPIDIEPQYFDTGDSTSVGLRVAQMVSNRVILLWEIERYSYKQIYLLPFFLTLENYFLNKDPEIKLFLEKIRPR